MSQVYENILDEKYRLVVNYHPEKDRIGILTLYDSDGKTVLLQQEVGLSYGAIFGPDIADAQLWQKMGIDFIDQNGLGPNK